MSNDGTPGQPGQPQWDATNGEWVSGPYRWDEQSQQWLPPGLRPGRCRSG